MYCCTLLQLFAHVVHLAAKVAELALLEQGFDSRPLSARDDVEFANDPNAACGLYSRYPHETISINYS